MRICEYTGKHQLIIGGPPKKLNLKKFPFSREFLKINFLDFSIQSKLIQSFSDLSPYLCFKLLTEASAKSDPPLKSYFV